MIGPGILAEGERNVHEVVYQKQIAATVSQLLGEKFLAPDHAVAAAFDLPTILAKPQPTISTSVVAAKNSLCH